MKTRIKPSTRAERQRVFLAYRDVFTEKNAHARTRKAIHGIVLQDWPAKKSRVGGCGIRKVVYILRALVSDGVFDSEAQVGKEFPNLLPKPSQNDYWVEQDRVPGTATGAGGKCNASLKRPIKTGCEGMNDSPKHQGRDTFPRNVHFALQPPRFPYETQHHILSTIQQLLEKSCFDFVKQWLPSILEKHGWNCAAAGELTEWLNILTRHARDLPNGCISTERQASLKNIAPAVARLRHTAVHRLHLTLEELLAQIRSACMLAEVLQDVRSTSTLQALYERVETQAKKMEHNIVAMQQRVDTTLVQIQRQKDALAQRQQQLLSYAAQQNIDIPVATGLALLESINVVLAPSKPNMAVEKQSIGGCDKNDAKTYGVTVEHDDIESDEDRLLADLM